MNLLKSLKRAIDFVTGKDIEKEVQNRVDVFNKELDELAQRGRKYD